MSPLPPLTPSPPEASGRRPSLRTRSSITEDLNSGPDGAEIILAKLRGMIAGGRQEKEAMLGTIAVAAHALTGATGAAIAMPQDGSVVCVGRSGEIAPELGDQLNVNSGISGECLRTGTSLRCDDAARDFHVDAEVCRQLGIQSIAVVPLRGRYGRVGVLEAFSSQSYAFNDDHMALLGRLAGLAESAWAQGSQSEQLGVETEPAAEAGVLEQEAQEDAEAPDFQTTVSAAPTWVEPEAPVESPRAAVASIPLAEFREIPRATQPAGIVIDGKWPYWTVTCAGALLFILMAFLGWKVWYKASLPVASTRPAASSQEAVPEASSGATSAGMAFRANVAGHPAARPAAPKAATRTTIRPSPSTATNSAAAVEPPDPTSVTASDSVSSTQSHHPAEVQNLVATSAALPRLNVPVSQGVTGGILIHKVLPVYPSEARQSRAQGIVILEGTVNEQGQMEGLKMVSGPPLLANAAIDAVSKWRYTPYVLNGKPVRKSARISISFIGP
jgi:TonB family protein